ncbi:solute carrier family 10 (sodium/bile acid cotransporter), member 7 [Kaistia soli DSM 19436]|uniref:Solute carrier family 10 (Sodium/bile acid cotransporter), member 7 n=1 Tax=Kaistia soli DSM 19436 TaxID=1122133 RepID=A0A1M5PTN8_9HYPH|nr:bile acid:sodium symporter family protein [Kaistia soli]SHH05254.1 solute carrier family 10 (sodium/bile acid cotransporter), member 7 [Kaistia soli DSM 19436]
MTIRGFTIDGFLLALVAVVAIAIILPGPGATGGILHMNQVATYGVGVIFFLYGLTLAPEKMKAGVKHWRLHICVQLCTFVLFPVVVLLIGTPLKGFVPPEVWIGFFYIAALPSTVSSSVAMTSLAHGNVPAAIFNATLSSLIGVFATPLLMAWFLSTSGLSMPLLPVIGKIVLLVLLPIIVGQVARHWLAGWAGRNNKQIKLADRAIILAIVYNSFSDSMVEGVWQGHDASLIIEIIVGVIALFFIIYWLMQIPCRLFGFNRADTIACLFCASKKSLATGVPLAPIIFGTIPGLGLIIAPIMLYHFCQLVIVSVIANRQAQLALAEA